MKSLPACDNYQTLDGSTKGHRNVLERIDAYDLLRLVNKNSTVIDIGCNRGLFGVALSPHIKHYSGIEANPGELNHGKAMAASKQLSNITYYNCRFEDFARSDSSGSYDLILMLAIIVYIDATPEDIACWIISSLNNNGRLVIEGHPETYLGEPACWDAIIAFLDKALILEKELVVKDRSLTRDLRVYKREAEYIGYGMVSQCHRLLSMVEKRYYGTNTPGGERHYQVALNHYNNEINTLNKLKGVLGTPNIWAFSNLLPQKSAVIYMSDCGDPITHINCPVDWKKQVINLETALTNCGVWHSDIKEANIRVREGCLYVIDFGLLKKGPVNFKLAEVIEGILKTSKARGALALQRKKPRLPRKGYKRQK